MACLFRILCVYNSFFVVVTVAIFRLTGNLMEASESDEEFATTKTIKRQKRMKLVISIKLNCDVPVLTSSSLCRIESYTSSDSDVMIVEVVPGPSTKMSNE